MAHAAENSLKHSHKNLTSLENHFCVFIQWIFIQHSHIWKMVEMFGNAVIGSRRKSSLQ